MSQTKVNPSEINNVKAYKNQIASQKRKLCCEIAKSYVHKIHEEPILTDGAGNDGPTIRSAASIYKKWVPKYTWCGYFVGFIGYLVDQQIKDIPLQNDTNTGASKAPRAGIFSSSPEDAQPGLAVKYRSSHVGIVVDVQGSGENMVVSVVEGNTSKLGGKGVEREGWIVEIKRRNIKDLRNNFQFYAKIWEEDNDHIGKNKITPDFNRAIQSDLPITDNRDTTLGRSGATREQIVSDWSEFMVDVSDNKFLDNNTLANSITKPEKETKKSKNTVEYEAKQVSETSIKLDKQIVTATQDTSSNWDSVNVSDNKLF